MKIRLSLSIVLIFTAILTSCVIYKSPERKDFESEYATFNVNNLSLLSCSGESVIANATASRLVYIHPNKNSIWEHIVNSQSIFESNNFQGEFCVYHYLEPHE